MVKQASRKKNTKTGTLRIGDQWNAINIIGRSQTHPLKAVCELTENAIDAKATQIQIVRRRRQGKLYLEVTDNGEGVPANDDGVPDFARIATHVCDSMKRHLDAQQRAGIHGEFGIGLLSFWSLGDELRMVSAGGDGRLFEMLLTRGKRNYTIRPIRGELAMGGTRVIVGPLLETTKKVVAGEKLARYLSTELRDRIRSSKVHLVILDRVSRKEIVVEPREFEGDRVDVPERLSTSYGDVLVELYFREQNHNSHESGVAIYKDGTRVLKDITLMDQFQRAPWSENRVEGVLDYAALEVAPGTRGGIVPDERLGAFVSAVQTLEPSLMTALELREQAESDKASRDILRQVHRAFRNALRDLPSNEYLFFDIPDTKTALPKTPSQGGTLDREGEGIAMPDARQATEQEPGPVEEPTPVLPFEPGPLATVRISPRLARRAPGEACELAAVARDEHGVRIVEGVEFSWIAVSGDATVVTNDDKARVRCEVTGEVQVQVLANQKGWSASDEVTVKFLENADKGDDDSSKGLPEYRLEPEHGRPWRSRYDEKKNEIIINSAHRDFMSSRTTAAKHRRYIGKLYAKEVVLINFPHESPSEVLERLVQLTLRTEDVL